MQEKRRKFVKNVLNNRINKKEYVTYDKKKHGSTEKDSESVYEEKRLEILKTEESVNYWTGPEIYVIITGLKGNNKDRSRDMIYS